MKLTRMLSILALATLIAFGFNAAVDAQNFNAHPIVGAAPVTATVTITSTQIIPANLGRRGIICINTGASNPLSLGLGTTAVPGQGITLFQNGGAWTLISDTVTNQAVNAASTSGTNIACQEFN